jgi:dihydropteroate synthase
MKWTCQDRVIDCQAKPIVMGILNVTPDSFSDGGRYDTFAKALNQAERLIAAGADILDIGGESSRPGAEHIPLDEELRRVVPVIQEIHSRHTIAISIDTTKVAVAEAAIRAGACIINDISGLTQDADMLKVAKATRAGVVIMHMQGTPKTMNLNPNYENVTAEVLSFLEMRKRVLMEAGVAEDALCFDPGIGFGKRNTHSMQLLRELNQLAVLGRPICLGVSRKGFIGAITGREVGERAAGSVGVACAAFTQNSAQIFRVHDVQETRDALDMIQAIHKPGGTT